MIGVNHSLQMKTKTYFLLVLKYENNLDKLYFVVTKLLNSLLFLIEVSLLK